MLGYCKSGFVMLALGLAGAAHAQFYGIQRSVPVPPQDWKTVDSRSNRIGTGPERGDIRDRIDDGLRSSQLSRRDARRLRRENAQLGVLANRYGSDGLSDSEANELDTRAAVLRAQVDNQRLGIGSATKRP